jgi:hypothetical protein
MHVRKVARHGFVTPILLTSSGIPPVRKKIYKPFAGKIEEDARLLTQAGVSLAKRCIRTCSPKVIERIASRHV